MGAILVPMSRRFLILLVLLPLAATAEKRPVTLDDVVADHRGVAGLERRRNLQPPLDRCEVADVLLPHLEAAGAQVAHPRLAAASGGILVHRRRRSGQGWGAQQQSQAPTEERSPPDPHRHGAYDTVSRRRAPTGGAHAVPYGA